MKLNRLVGMIFTETCHHHKLRSQEYETKRSVIKQALINTVILKNTNSVSFNTDILIEIKFQRINKNIEQNDTIYVCVEYGYQNIRIYNVDLKDTISLGELSSLLKQK